MLGWFKKKKPQELPPELKALSEKFFAPQAQAVAIAERVREYVDAVQAKEVEYPAHRRKDASVLELWTHIRLEAWHKIFNFGKSDLMLLADIRQQLTLLNSFLDERPHFEFPQPRGELIADTLQGVWQVYIYLSTVGSELADNATDTHTLKSRGRDILSDFTDKATSLRTQWQAFDRAMKNKDEVRPDMPETIIAIFWEDVTAKTKSIAVSKVFGPIPESNIQYMLKLLAEKATEKEVAEMRAYMDRVRAAKEPEDIRAS
ncbi:MAG: hypothetical protein KGO94_01270 [Alphaproteobacteria bacterium]|nr:hypothetical protein [Alphaproteobacteria bacterium]